MKKNSVEKGGDKKISPFKAFFRVIFRANHPPKNLWDLRDVLFWDPLHPIVMACHGTFVGTWPLQKYAKMKQKKTLEAPPKLSFLPFSTEEFLYSHGVFANFLPASDGQKQQTSAFCGPPRASWYIKVISCSHDVSGFSEMRKPLGKMNRLYVNWLLGLGYTHNSPPKKKLRHMSRVAKNTKKHHSWKLPFRLNVVPRKIWYYCWNCNIPRLFGEDCLHKLLRIQPHQSIHTVDGWNWNPAPPGMYKTL